MPAAFSRRNALAAAFAGPLLMPAAPVGAAGSPGSGAAASGAFAVTFGGTLLGVLLPPPIKRTSMPMRFQLFDIFGNAVVDAPINTRTSLWELTYDPEGSILVAQERGSGRTFTVPNSNGILNAVLSPGASQVTSGGIVGAVQVLDRWGAPERILPLVEQYPSGGPVSGAAVGPFLTTEGQTALIHLLIPAVQKIRDAPVRVHIVNSALDIVASHDLDVSGVRFRMFAIVDRTRLEGGVATVEHITGTGAAIPVGSGPCPDGLLSCIVQPVSRGGQLQVLGGSAQTPGATVQFKPLFAPLILD